MGRKPKLYVPLTVTFLEDDRIIQVGDGPTLLYVAMLLHCKACGSDGRITELQVARLHRPRWRSELRSLLSVGLIFLDHDDLYIAGWLKHNESMAALDAKRAADRDRKAENSSRNPVGFHSDSALKERKGKGREGRNPVPLHRFADAGDGVCSDCSLPSMNSVHLRSVESAS